MQFSLLPYAFASPLKLDLAFNTDPPKHWLSHILAVPCKICIMPAPTDKGQGSMGHRMAAARALGFAYWYRTFLTTNGLGGSIDGEQLLDAIRNDFEPNRREYNRLGLSAVTRLEAMGYEVVPVV